MYVFSAAEQSFLQGTAAFTGGGEVIMHPLNNEIRGCSDSLSEKNNMGQRNVECHDSFAVAVHLCRQLTIFNLSEQYRKTYKQRL